MVEFPRPEVYAPLQIAFGDVVSSYTSLDFYVIVDLGEGGGQSSYQEFFISINMRH